MTGDEDDRLRIGRRIQRLRAEHGLTQRALAEPAYTAAYISTLESGKARPSETALRYLAERLGVSAEQLETGRPPHLATDLRLRLTDARQTLHTGEAADATAQFTELAAEAQRHGLADEQAAALVGLGDCALEAGELDQAIGHFQAAEDLLRQAPLPLRVPALRGRAVAHLLAGDLRYSCYLLESAIDQLNSDGLPDPQALLLLYSAVIAPYLDLGAHRRAAQAAELALALAPQVDDPAAVARLHRSVARTLLAGGRAAEADASWPGPRSSTSNCGSAPNSRTATGCAATCAPRTATCPLPSVNCAPPAESWRTVRPRSTPSRSTSSWPTCCAARVAARRRRPCWRTCWAHCTPSAARCTRAPPTGCWGSSPRSAARTPKPSSTIAPHWSCCSRPEPPPTWPTCAGCWAICCAAPASRRRPWTSTAAASATRPPPGPPRSVRHRRHHRSDGPRGFTSKT